MGRNVVKDWVTLDSGEEGPSPSSQSVLNFGGIHLLKHEIQDDSIYCEGAKVFSEIFADVSKHTVQRV